MLKEKLESDLKQSLKAKDLVAVSTLRMLLAALKNKEIEKRGDLDDAEIVKVLAAEKKKHLDSIAQFETGGRADLVAKEKAEALVVERYLPAALPEAELRKLVGEAVSELSATTPKDFGAVMKLVMSRAGASADGSRVSALVKEFLNK